VFVKDTAKKNTNTIKVTWKHEVIARSTQQKECLAENTIVYVKNLSNIVGGDADDESSTSIT
jgi:uncharacterized protein (DUF427 family)